MLRERDVILVYRALFDEVLSDRAEIRRLASFEDISSLRAALIGSDSFKKAILGATAKAVPVDYIDDSGFVDANKLAAHFSLEQHQQNANAYFASIADPWQYHLRKPYAEAQECCHILTGLSSILAAMKLVPGHKVLDFGCGTGWLSHIFAYLRCHAVGLDVSPAAIKIAESALASHPIREQLNIEFIVFNGRDLPFGEASFDRIVCFDSFHHVPDQDSLISEFGRILRPGGVAVFHEPGPTHASSPQSQYEMKHYRVIENNIFVEHLGNVAASHGFEPIKLIMNTQQPLMYSLEDFQKGLADSQPSDFFVGIGRSIVRDFVGKRIFLLAKVGDEVQDSRNRMALKGEIVLEEFQFDNKRREFTSSITVRNTGSGTWRPSGSAVGSVNIGIRLFHADGSPLDTDYSRHQVLKADLPPGTEQTVEVNFQVRYEATTFIVEFDLVAELVAWFSEIGCTMPRVSIGGSPRRVASATARRVSPRKGRREP